METKRVLHILHSMNRGGAENAIMNYYRHIDRSIIQFDFLLTCNEKSAFEDEIISLGGEIWHIRPLKIWNPWPYLLDILVFFKAHPEYKIVHSHTSSKSFFPLAVAKACDIPVRCAHSHNSKTERGFTGIFRTMLMPMLKWVATDYLACGEQAAIWLFGERSFNRGEVRIFNNVIETDAYSFDPPKRKEIRNQLKLKDTTLVVGHVARFSEQKNHCFDINLMKRVKEKGMDCKLLLVGDGELRETIIARAKELDVLNDIIFAGVVPNVNDYLQAMDVFILPSLCEGLPLSVIEAQTSGLPCIVSKGNVPEECGVTDLVSFLPLNSSIDIWAQRVMELSIKKRIDHTKQIIDAGYDAETMSVKLMNFYNSKYSQ